MAQSRRFSIIFSERNQGDAAKDTGRPPTSGSSILESTDGQEIPMVSRLARAQMDAIPHPAPRAHSAIHENGTDLTRIPFPLPIQDSLLHPCEEELTADHRAVFPGHVKVPLFRDCRRPGLDVLAGGDLLEYGRTLAAALNRFPVLLERLAVDPAAFQEPGVEADQGG